MRALGVFILTRDYPAPVWDDEPRLRMGVLCLEELKAATKARKSAKRGQAGRGDWCCGLFRLVGFIAVVAVVVVGREGEGEEKGKKEGLVSFLSCRNRRTTVRTVRRAGMVVRGTRRGGGGARG